MVDTRFAVSVHVMTALANNQPDLVSSEELARSVKTNPSFIRKLVVSLSSAGLVQSVRGKAGGIRLAKSPREISLAEIYRAIAPTPRLAVPGKTPEKTCPIACGMGAVLCAISKEIEDGTLKMLAKRNLQDVLGQISGR